MLVAEENNLLTIDTVKHRIKGKEGIQPYQQMLEDARTLNYYNI